MLTNPYSHEEVEATEVSLPDPTDAEIREHLQVILASDQFASSRRASELLQHLVERTLAGDAASLKERLLGVEIFHRRSDYNTGTDAIVRVTANDVRRRLNQFYSTHPDQSLLLSLPLGSYVPDFLPMSPRTSNLPGAAAPHLSLETSVVQLIASATPNHLATHSKPPAEPTTVVAIGKIKPQLLYIFGLVLAVALGWAMRAEVRSHGALPNSDYSFYGDLLGPIGLPGATKTEIALTNPHVLLYLGLKAPGPSLGTSPKDLPVPADMAAVLNSSANDSQADFPYHHFFVDQDNYTGMGEAKAAFGLAKTLVATGRDAQLTEERFLNWENGRQEHLVILGAPHESKFVQDTLSEANFTIGYDSIHNAHPLPGEQTDYVKSHIDNVMEDYGLIWMTQSPSGTRVLVLAGLSSPGTAGVGEFFSDPERMKAVHQQLRAAVGEKAFPDSWQVLVRIEARQDVPVSVTPIAIRITRSTPN